jgi:hypothetical protein
LPTAAGAAEWDSERDSAAVVDSLEDSALGPMDPSAVDLQAEWGRVLAGYPAADSQAGLEWGQLADPVGESVGDSAADSPAVGAWELLGPAASPLAELLGEVAAGPEGDWSGDRTTMQLKTTQR